ncbi:hypothetical protein IAQ61_002450 [Plenodomus lingam]|uniref:Avirulence Effector AvrLm4-7 domain-containing protein n=1 Tax=Leptosphaeria maculans (strain JN3 / isolate v23.1.3 / race Av1-4-5-6-7-8) TaxID=985895 RepID=E4ZIG0_LEPMJ|nr:hypothetical protein LEMA_P060150.1 [Plenodomus lingam JN3]KAH9877087.1 hypothetical protein IAQ61_002450 [Plenodomus lingam]CBX90981.1 hypothetical protein LEMA_P060150.1 [Plenodomus lingam JN3]
MRQSLLTLWLTTIFILFAPGLACKKRYFRYTNSWRNCNEGRADFLKERLKEDCEVNMTQTYLQHNSRVNGALGAEISGELERTYSPPDVESCITYRCTITAWRFREWQNNDFDDKGKILFNTTSWRYESTWYSPDTNKC